MSGTFTTLQAVSAFVALFFAAGNLFHLYETWKIVRAARKDLKKGNNSGSWRISPAGHCESLVGTRNWNLGFGLGLVCSTPLLMASGNWSYMVLLPAVLGAIDLVVVKEFLLNAEDAVARVAIDEGTANELPMATQKRFPIVFDAA